MNLWAAVCPPLISKVKMDAAAVGEILLVQRVVRVVRAGDGWFTCSTCG